MIAMALACDPAIVIGDEPTTALDVMVQAQILQLLERLRRELGLSLILITHDLSVIAETCDRVLIMYAGKVAEEGPVARMFTAPRHPYTQKLLSRVPQHPRRPADARRHPGRAAGPAPPAARLPVRTRAARSRWTSAARSSRPRSASPTASGSPATCIRRRTRGRGVTSAVPDRPPADPIRRPRSPGAPMTTMTDRRRRVARRRARRRPATVAADAAPLPMLSPSRDGRSARLRRDLEVHFPIRGGSSTRSCGGRAASSGPWTGST